MIKDVMDIAERYGCNMVYLFGSQADNGRRYLEGGYVVPEPSSDLDLAVAFETPPLDVFKIYGSLYKEFSDIFEPFEVDIVFMHEVDILFKFEIIKGVRIYEKDAIISDEFEEEVIKRAGDLIYKKRIFNKEIMEAVEDGYFEFEYSPNP
ncbi:MAG: hypothetical protein A3J72_03980 [Nitrospirae bacterium RIFCSPHIGHO2_02_FULL_40_19]|nr:MAG: hypothetical protein A3J72_03980 [Nitrospirae bacterium RIFCSPHIGHO2_02_FULL_40_19]